MLVSSNIINDNVFYLSILSKETLLSQHLHESIQLEFILMHQEIYRKKRRNMVKMLALSVQSIYLLAGELSRHTNNIDKLPLNHTNAIWIFWL